jgi:hypothetical protein
MNKPIYHSVFKTEFNDLVEIKKALGFTYDSEAVGFQRIDTHLAEKMISKELCNEWCKKRSYETEHNRSHRISVMRVFCKYLNDIGIQHIFHRKGLLIEFLSIMPISIQEMN